MPFLSPDPIPFDPFLVGAEYGIREVTPRLMERGTPETRREQHWLKILLKDALNRLGDATGGVKFRLRSRDGMTYITFAAGFGSGRIAAGIDVLTGRPVYQLRASSLSTPIAKAVLESVRENTQGLGRPLRVIGRSKAPAAFDAPLYRPDRVMTYRVRGRYGLRADVMTCWVDCMAMADLLRVLVKATVELTVRESTPADA